MPDDTVINVIIDVYDGLDGPDVCQCGNYPTYSAFEKDSMKPKHFCPRCSPSKKAD